MPFFLGQCLIYKQMFFGNFINVAFRIFRTYNLLLLFILFLIFENTFEKNRTSLFSFKVECK